MSKMFKDGWYLYEGDCIPHMEKLSSNGNPPRFDFAVFSPPFPSLYAYTDKSEDLGNSEDFGGEAILHLNFFYKQLAKMVKPGRAIVVHIAQIPRLRRSGGEGLVDFRGINIRLGERAGLTYVYDWLVSKNPQALRNGTGVWTPRGVVPIDCLVVGSEVIGSNGQPTRVSGVWSHTRKQMFRVMFNDRTFVDCDGNHQWNVNRSMGVHNSERTVKTTQVLYDVGVLMPGGGCRWVVPMPPCAVFGPPAELPLDPYLVGVLLGDGMLSSRGVVGVCTEKEIVESLDLPGNHYAAELPDSQRGNTVSSHHIRCYQWHRNDVLDGCRELGMVGKRCWEKRIPVEYLFADRDARIATLQGLMDTDGTIKQGGSCFFASTSKALIDGVQFLVESLGGICRVSVEESPTYEYKGEVRFGRTRYVGCVRFPASTGICPFRMKRKADKWYPLARQIHRRIVSIEKVGVSDCTCITVEAEDGLFVAEHGIVTHNSQAIRSHAHELQFAGLEKDRARSRGALADYLIKFMVPGENKVPVTSADCMNRNDWIAWAEAAWTWKEIRATDTLNTKEGKGEDDTKHICPLQLGVIKRLVLLYTNPGEIVFSPFAGIGSEGYIALLHRRRFYGCEIKSEYIAAAKKNFKRAILKREKQTLLGAM